MNLSKPTSYRIIRNDHTTNSEIQCNLFATTIFNTKRDFYTETKHQLINHIGCHETQQLIRITSN